MNKPIPAPPKQNPLIHKVEPAKKRTARPLFHTVAQNLTDAERYRLIGMTR